MHYPVAMDTVTIVAIGVLATVFVGSLVTLIIVCQKKYCKRMDLISQQHQENEPDVNLVENMEGPVENPAGVELDDVRFTQNMEEFLNNEDWVNDATGLSPHTLAILKTCHLLTEKLVCMTMGNAQQLRTPEALNDLVATAKRIGPRVDDVVKAMYPPLDPRLLEARCSALVLQVYHLVLVVKNMCHLSGVLDWVDQSLADVEDHLKVLRDASIAYESSFHSASSEPGSVGSHSNLSTTAASNEPAPVPAIQENESSEV
ncbi:hypothetical protein LSH36_481g03053 [Paralvinella palmiformis]|uniref:Transmembrane protein 98 n=1 Tax=Paralvinella palmiformis TaxID=53620 RepID=A0AAD9J981_9ANNE|nr:hypothetical protein LSH36_481g03053 [Paralvinella palmiformis]